MCVCVSVLTHLDCSTMISIRTLASSFLLTKPISSSASSASTSTTGRGRESVSRSWLVSKVRRIMTSRRYVHSYIIFINLWRCGCTCTLTSAAALASSLTSKITAWAPLSSAMRAWGRRHRRGFRVAHLQLCLHTGHPSSRKHLRFTSEFIQWTADENNCLCFHLQINH